MPETTFVGRDKYIDQFRRLLVSPLGSPYILNLRGPGGIGKTKILQQFIGICREEVIPNTGIIDFYDSELNSQINKVELAIAKAVSNKLEDGPFALYWQARQEAEESLRNEDELYRVLREKSKNQFIEDLSNWAKESALPDRKVALIFDTFEAIKNNQVGARLLNEWLPILKPAIVVLSGRQQEGEIVFPAGIVNLVVDAPVEVFTRDEAISYLKKRGVWEEIDQDGVTNSLLELTEQQPLRLALSADRLTRYNFLNRISPAQLTEGADKANFERKLVEDLVNDIEYPESIILPAMAHIPRPFDAKLIKFLFPMYTDDPEKILKNLSEISFVKEIIESGQPRYWFQDELRQLVHQYIFLRDDFTWKQSRRDASESMIKFYNEQIDEAEKTNDRLIKERFIADRFYHEIFLNPKEKFSEAQKFFQGSREIHQNGYANVMLGALHSAVNFLDEEQRFALRLMEARSLRDNGYAESSEAQLRQLLQEYEQEPEKVLYIYNSLAGSVEKLGKLKEALDYYNQSLSLSETLGRPARLFREHRNIGRIHEMMGYWEAAIEHFKQAYNLAIIHQVDENQTANILSDLGYAYGLRGEYKAALDYCNQAIDNWETLQLRQKEDLSQKIAAGKVTRGAIYRMAGRYPEALNDLQEAINFLYSSEYATLARAYSELGFTQWSQSKEPGTTVKDKLLAKAQRTLEEGLSIAKDYNVVHEQPRLLRRLGHVYWDQGRKEDARQNNREAYRLGKEIHDIHFSINSLVGMAEFDDEEGKHESIPEYVKTLKTEFEEASYQFPLLYGRMRRIQGNVAFQEQQYDRAIDYYAEALYLIAQHGGYGPYSIDQEIRNLEEKLRTLPAEVALESCQALKTTLTQKRLDKSNPEMISWLDRLISQLIFRGQVG